MYSNFPCHSDSEYLVPEPVLKESQTSHNNILENPLTEIQRHTLSSLEYEGLKTLFCASPIYHQQYLLGHQHLLHECFKTSLGNGTIDADAFYRSGLVDFLAMRNERKSINFLGPIKITTLRPNTISC